jgi:hypothetical protein
MQRIYFVKIRIFWRSGEPQTPQNANPHPQTRIIYWLSTVSASPGHKKQRPKRPFLSNVPSIPFHPIHLFSLLPHTPRFPFPNALRTRIRLPIPASGLITKKDKIRMMNTRGGIRAILFWMSLRIHVIQLAPHA